MFKFLKEHRYPWKPLKMDCTFIVSGARFPGLFNHCSHWRTLSFYTYNSICLINNKLCLNNYQRLVLFSPLWFCVCVCAIMIPTVAGTTTKAVLNIVAGAAMQDTITKLSRFVAEIKTKVKFEDGHGLRLRKLIPRPIIHWNYCYLVYKNILFSKVRRSEKSSWLVRLH